MSLHLRCVLDEHAEVLDYRWYCSSWCYRESMADDPPTEVFEAGGAYPCGVETDSPVACSACDHPVGNPLTDAGRTLVEDWLASDPGEFASACGDLYGIDAAPFELVGSG